MSNHIPSLITSKNYLPQGLLDYKIPTEELKKAATVLKPGKAVGFDNAHNEMISSMMDTHPKLILKLFNCILNSCEIIADWLIGFIVPIRRGEV